MVEAFFRNPTSLSALSFPSVRKKSKDIKHSEYVFSDFIFELAGKGTQIVDNCQMEQNSSFKESLLMHLENKPIKFGLLMLSCYPVYLVNVSLGKQMVGETKIENDHDRN
jgi:hypothetical protein